MPDNKAFNTAAYVADLRAAGFMVQAHPLVRGRSCFAVLSEQGVGDDLLDVELKYRASKKADPDAKRRIIDFLAAEHA